MELIQPLDILNKTNPVIFLAGPIQNAPDWHGKVILGLFDKLRFPVTIASPKIVGNKPNNWTYEKQVNWESKYLNKAAESGIIIFWLANQANENSERSYAQTTRFELSEWFTKYKINQNINLIIGIEPGFRGERYIRYRISTESNIQIVNKIQNSIN